LIDDSNISIVNAELLHFSVGRLYSKHRGYYVSTPLLSDIANAEILARVPMRNGFRMRQSSLTAQDPYASVAAGGADGRAIKNPSRAWKKAARPPPSFVGGKSGQLEETGT
jgi:hypothetical protein